MVHWCAGTSPYRVARPSPESMRGAARRHQYPTWLAMRLFPLRCSRDGARAGHPPSPSGAGCLAWLVREHPPRRGHEQVQRVTLPQPYSEDFFMRWNASSSSCTTMSGRPSRSGARATGRVEACSWTSACAHGGAAAEEAADVTGAARWGPCRHAWHFALLQNGALVCLHRCIPCRRRTRTPPCRNSPRRTPGPARREGSRRAARSWRSTPTVPCVASQARPRCRGRDRIAPSAVARLATTVGAPAARLRAKYAREAVRER